MLPSKQLRGRTYRLAPGNTLLLGGGLGRLDLLEAPGPTLYLTVFVSHHVNLHLGKTEGGWLCRWWWCVDGTSPCVRGLLSMRHALARPLTRRCRWALPVCGVTGASAWPRHCTRPGADERLQRMRGAELSPPEDPERAALLPPLEPVEVEVSGGAGHRGVLWCQWEYL